MVTKACSQPGMVAGRTKALPTEYDKRERASVNWMNAHDRLSVS
jgi:hypothetical protein